MTAYRIINPRYTARPLTQAVLPADVGNSLILELDPHYAQQVGLMRGKPATHVQANVLRWQQQHAIRNAARSK